MRQAMAKKPSAPPAKRKQGPTGLGQVGQNLVNQQQRVPFDPNYMAGFNAGDPSGSTARFNQGPQGSQGSPQVSRGMPQGPPPGMTRGLSQMGSQVNDFLSRPQYGGGPNTMGGNADDFGQGMRGNAMQPWGGGGSYMPSFMPYQDSAQYMPRGGGPLQMFVNQMRPQFGGGFNAGDPSGSTARFNTNEMPQQWGGGGLERAYGGMQQGFGGGYGGGPSPQIQQAIQQMQQQRAMMQQAQMMQQMQGGMGAFGGGYGGGYGPMAGGAGNTWASLFGGR